MTTDNLAPSVGAGPYGVEHDAEGGFYLTLDGARTGKVYYVGKTAYRAARQLNENAEAPVFLDDAPQVTPSPATGGDAGAGDAPASPKAPKSRKARADARVKPIARTTTIPGFAPAPSPKPVKPKPPKAKAAPKVEEPAKVYEGSREEWLNAFIAAARPVFKARGLELPEKIRASVGFMFRGGKAIGQCWHEAASTDGTREIFVIPTLDDSYRIADVVTHELAHTLFGPDEKHGRNFKEAVTKLGLEGKATATVAGPGWLEWATPILEDLGRIPHARLDPKLSGVKKQKTYLLKCECEACGLIFRATAKAINGKTLRCTDADCDGLVKVEGAEESGE